MMKCKAGDKGEFDPFLLGNNKGLTNFEHVCSAPNSRMLVRKRPAKKNLVK